MRQGFLSQRAKAFKSERKRCKNRAVNYWSEVSGEPPSTITGGGEDRVDEAGRLGGQCPSMAVLLSAWGRMLGFQMLR